MNNQTAELSARLASSGSKMVPLGFEKTMADWFKVNLSRIVTFTGSEEVARKIMAGLMYSASRVPKLMQCSPSSLFDCIMQSAQLGLIPGALGQCSYLPFNNRKKGTLEATFVPGYQGLIELAYAGGQLQSIQTDVVYEADDFSFEKGTKKFLRHVPFIGPDNNRGEKIAVYCVIETRFGSHFEVKSVDWVTGIRKQSARGGSEDSPWATHWDEMARKSIFKHASKWIPKNEKLEEALALDNSFESGRNNDPIIPQGVQITDPVEEPPAPPESKITADPAPSTTPKLEAPPAAIVVPSVQAEELAEKRKKLAAETANLLGVKPTNNK